MTILNIAIPSSRRNSIFALSAPGTAAVLAPSAPPTALPGSQSLGLLMPDQLNRALLGLVTLDEYLPALATSDLHQRQLARDQLVEALQKEQKLRLAGIGTANQNPLMSDVFTTKLLSFASADDLDAKWAAVISVKEILKITIPDPKLAVRLATALCRVVPCNDHALLREAAKLFATMISLDGMARLANVQIPQFLEWLRDARSDRKRLGAIVLLDEIMRNEAAELIVVDHAQRAIAELWDCGLTSGKPEIREASRSAMESCLQVLPDAYQRTQGGELLDQAIGSMTSFAASSASLHGSVLACSVLISLEGDFERELLIMWPAILKVKDKDVYVSQAAMEFMQRAAIRCPEQFKQHWIGPCLTWLLKESRREDLQVTAIDSLAKILPVAKRDAVRYLDDIVSCSHAHILQASTHQATVDLLGSCAQAFGPDIESAISPCLDQMFNGGLSKALVGAMQSITAHIPGLAHAGRDRLLDAIANALAGSTYAEVVFPQARPSHGRRASTASVAGFLAPASDQQRRTSVERKRASSLLDRARGRSISPHRTAQPTVTPASESTVEKKLLALETLASFDFGEQPMLGSFFFQCVVPLSTPACSTELRKAAVSALMHQLLQCAQANPVGSGHSLGNTLLASVLAVAVADPYPDVREHALGLLSPDVDGYLVEPKALQMLLCALNDEALAVRLAILGVLARLLESASAAILPVLRNELTSLVVQMEHIKLPSARAQSLLVLTQVVEAAPLLAELYSGPLINLLLRGRVHEDEEAAIRSFGLLRVIARHAGNAMRPHALAFAHQAVTAVKDQTSATKRREAVLTLTAIVASTVCMKELAPYRDDFLHALVKHLAAETDAQAKRDVVRCLGMIGASKPYQSAVTQVDPDMVSTASIPGGPSTQDRLENGLIAFDQAEVYDRLPEWIADAVLIELIKVWNEPSLHTFHFAVVDAVVRIFRWDVSKNRSWQHARPIVKKLISEIADSTHDMATTCFYISSLGNFAREVGSHMEEHMLEVMPILMRRWEAGVEPGSCMVNCIHSLAGAVRGCFKTTLPIVFPKMASLLIDPAVGEATALSVLRFCQASAALLKDWLHVAMPALFAACESPSCEVQQMALDTIVEIASQVYVLPHLSRMMPNFVRLVKSDNQGQAATKAMCELVKECGSDASGLVHAYEGQLGFSIYDHPCFREYTRREPMEVETSFDRASPSDTILVRLDSQGVLSAFTPLAHGEDDWLGWLSNLCLQTMRSAPNHHIRTCGAIAEQYQELREKLLNFATYAAWLDLSKEDKATVLGNIEHILDMSVPGKVHDVLLHLIDFMTRMGIDFSVSPRLCKEVAMARKFNHRASRYAELEYEDLDDPAVLADLLDINHQFQAREPDHARGLQQIANSSDPRFLESLQDISQWQAALLLHQHAASEDPSDKEALHGIFRCLHAQEQWDLMLDCADQHESSTQPDFLRSSGPLLAKAAWNLGEYERMSTIVDHLQSPDKEFYSAVLATAQNEHAETNHFLDLCRDAISVEIASTGATRTGRAYDALVRTQLLTELEEAATFRAHRSQRDLIRDRWTTRLDLVQKENEVFQRYLAVHRLAIEPHEDVAAYVKFARTCRKNGRNDMAFNAQRAAMGPANADPLDVLRQADNEDSSLTLERCRLAFAYGHHDKAIEGLKLLTGRIGGKLDGLALVQSRNRYISAQVETERALLGRTMHTLGDYCQGQDMTSLTEAQICYERSVEFLPTIKGFRKLATTNLAIMELLETDNTNPPMDTIVLLAVSVIDSYVQMISKNSSWPLQDVLGLLTIATKYGMHSEVVDATEVAFKALPIDCWMEAIPQLAAHLNYPEEDFQRVIEAHMAKLASAHPHTMLATLASVARFPNKERAEVAMRLLDSMRAYQNALVEEALLLNRELIRVAATWEEVCLGGIERASAYLFGGEGKNPKGLCDALEAMCRGFDQPETVDECDFVMKYAASLRAARDIGKSMLKNGVTDRALSHLWREWHKIHRGMSTAVKEKPLTFDLLDASPRLANARNLAFSVPGTYMRLAHEGPDICIAFVHGTVEVLSSKQRPRKLSIKGSDGRDYGFLLKPREDLRLDERCAQMFTLVNSLLRSNPEAAKRHLRVVRFEVLPLNDRAGLIQWVARADTLQNVCRLERKISGVPVDIELKAQVSHAPDINKGTLSSMQQVECLDLALELTKGTELATVLWKKSSSAASWLERRTAYCRSLATNSMVGHLLGLGDRHPSNLLQDRITGELVQIDFGDAFEAAMERAQFPERMPMRLTRQMIKCAGPTGVEGSFRICSEITMRILRNNKDSVEAVLEAFVRDPLIQHLVLNPREIDPRSGRPAERAMPVDEHRYQSQSGGSKNVTQLSSKAQRAIARAKAKLQGKEFNTIQPLPVDEQVARLIIQATDPYVLASAYQGWCPFW